MTINLSGAKSHLRIDYDDDDVLIQLYIDAATLHAERYLRRDFATEYPDALPRPIEVAILQHVAEMYRDREANQKEAGTVPPLMWFDLLSTYRVFS
ncbi:MAG: head-tail connector protein [Alphaproteobacteria bacterium]|uniref:Putative head-tail connector n=1 Tax=viral metagenome TaxID=1070528 RepID=A0A6M3KBE0_9ZZZZ|nr:head-tail connector protein [Alphaproteobacteria bacterium]MBU1280266.1 head-tail connector protein [Alphaproteobacteria bacterium]MBU1573005.1 head-tail connector protein [Alphaproteobacteria bacterium]MBU1827212.1 head-tail connector protein [Alphaproteobacteria bacterium]MBU2079964.1 head-tail connector protein [Alphaproteobacteria bacterium]